MDSQEGDAEIKEKRKRGAKIQKTGSGGWHSGHLPGARLNKSRESLPCQG